MNGLHDRVSRGLGAAGYHSARRPWTTLGLCLLTCLCCLPGFARFSIETDGYKLWTAQDSTAFGRKNYVDENWERGGTVMKFLIQAKGMGQNALTMSAFREAFDIQDEIYMTKDSNGNTFKDLCLKDLVGQCMSLGALRFFNSNRTEFEAQVQDDADLLAALSEAAYPDTGGRVARDEIFGNLKTSGLQITSAGIWRMGFGIEGTHDREFVLAWEKKILSRFVKEDSTETEQRWQSIHVEVWSTGRSLDDELERSVGGDITFMVIAYLFLVAACALMLGNPCKCVHGRRLLGSCDFFLVILATVAGYGLACAFAVPFTSLAQVLPFILVGIGIDDAFVIVSAFDRTDRSKLIEDRMRTALMHEGVSVTLTSLTDITAFFAGSTAAFPAVSYFCIYAGFSLCFVYGFHITAFCALLALDERRLQSGRFDVICCLRSKEEVTSIRSDRESLDQRIMEKYTRAITHNITVKLSILACFVSFAGICIWQAVEKTTTEFNLMTVAPDVSYMRDFLSTEKKYWGADSTGLKLPLDLFFRDVKADDAYVQDKMRKAEENLLSVPCVDGKYGIRSWHRGFTKWALSSPDFEASSFEKVNGVSYLSGSEFYPALNKWLSDCRLGCRFRNDVKVSNGAIARALVTARQVTLFSTDEQANCLTEIEDFNEKAAASVPGTFAFTRTHVIYHQFRIIRQELLYATGMCFIAVFLITLVIITHPLAAGIIFGVVLLVFIDLMGCIPIAGLSLNSISMINLVMAIGLVVDYSMHVAHSFMFQAPHLSRNERTVLAMRQIGLPVAKGIFSTFVAIIPLAFASSEVFRVFFKMFLAILIVGGSHGLVLMPVVLSLIGPSSRAPDTRNLARVTPTEPA